MFFLSSKITPKEDEQLFFASQCQATQKKNALTKNMFCRNLEVLESWSKSAFLSFMFAFAFVERAHLNHSARPCSAVFCQPSRVFLFRVLGFFGQVCFATSHTNSVRIQFPPKASLLTCATWPAYKRKGRKNCSNFALRSKAQSVLQESPKKRNAGCSQCVMLKAGSVDGTGVSSARRAS